MGPERQYKTVSEVGVDGMSKRPSSTPPILNAITTHTLRLRIADSLREAILDGRLKSGDRLVESSLAHQFGASLTSVREALIHLETEGFITKKPNSSTTVTALTQGEVEKILGVRRVLEGYAVEEAARNITPESAGELDRLYLAMVEAGRSNDSKSYILRDYAWHQAVWAAAGNEYLEAALRRVVLPFFAFAGIRIIAECGIDIVNDAYAHLPILQALKARDGEAARNALNIAMDGWLLETRRALFADPAEEAGKRIKLAPVAG